MQKETILVSACLLGVKCRYDGGTTYCPSVVELMNRFDLVPVCPELLGGMPVPRTPAEIVGDRVISQDGEDRTDKFRAGALETLALALKFRAARALLKSGSPSCGCDFIHDGKFSGKLIPGNGLTAAVFRENGIEVCSELDLSPLLGK